MRVRRSHLYDFGLGEEFLLHLVIGSASLRTFPGACMSIPETKNYYTHPGASLTLPYGQLPPVGGAWRIKEGGGGGGDWWGVLGPTSAHQRASVALCAALGLSLVLPYGYACAFTRALPVRSMGRWGVRSHLPILRAIVWASVCHLVCQ